MGVEKGMKKGGQATDCCSSPAVLRTPSRGKRLQGALQVQRHTHESAPVASSKVTPIGMGVFFSST